MSTTVHRTKVIPVGFGEMTIGWLCTGDPELMLCTLGFEVDEPPMTDAHVTAIRTAWQNFWSSAGNFTTEYTLSLVRVTLPTDGPGPVIIEQPSTQAGIVAGTACPPNVSILVEKVTGFGGRRNRGRMYLPCVIEADIAPNGNWLSGEDTQRNVALNTLRGDLTTAAATNIADLMIFHSYEWVGDEDPGPPPGFPPPVAIIDLECDPKVATQRRRLRR